MRRIYYLVVIVFIVSTFVIVGKRFLEGDSSGKPPLQDLTAYLMALPRPCAIPSVVPNEFSKYSLLGSVVNYSCPGSVDAISEHYRLAAQAAGWYMKSGARRMPASGLSIAKTALR